MKRKSIYIGFIALLLAVALCLCACGKDTQETESGETDLQTYQLPTEWTVSVDSWSWKQTYTVAYDGSTAEVTKDGKLLLRVTLDEAGNVIYREEANGFKLEAVYDADGRLTATLLRNADGKLQRRTEYEDGRAVRDYTRGWADEVTLREYTYGEDGELLTETMYSDCRTALYEYHENGVPAAKTTCLMGTLPYERLEYDADGVLLRLYEYDEEGKVLYRCEFDAEGDVTASYDENGNLYESSTRVEKIYDENGNLTEYRSLNDDGSVSWRDTYVYDGEGNCIEERHYDGESTLMKEEFHTYNEAGVRTKTVFHSYRSSDGERMDTVETEYDEAGNTTRHTYYDGEGTLISGMAWEYRFIAGEWRMLRSLSYDAEGTLQMRREFDYDEAGNNTAAYEYDGEGILSTRGEMRYDEQNRLTDQIHYDGDGQVIYRMEMRYDEQGNLREQTSYAMNGSIDTHHVYDYAYVYDDAGRLASETARTPVVRKTYAYKTGSGLRSETCTDENGTVRHAYETVYDGRGNPRIEQRNEDGYETRYEYQWGEDGGLLSRVRYDGNKEVVSRLETSGHVACRLTEAQYRKLLELLLTETEYTKDEYQFPTEGVLD